MSFDTEIIKSTATHRVLVEVDIGQSNTQWVNIGAGIWKVNATNTYPYVDSSLLGGFTAQDFGPIGSVYAEGLPLDYRATLAGLTDSPNAFHYDTANRDLYICLVNYDEPYLHTLTIGLITGFSAYGFAPLNGPGHYDGRLQSSPGYTVRRDPLFFGRISYGGVTVNIANGDGALDAWGNSTDIYGQNARVLFGFADVDYSEYVRIFNGYIEKISVGEDSVSLRIEDKRRQLTKPITYSCTDLNALEAIEEILGQSYGYTYDANFYDTTAWEIARDVVEDVTIDMQESDSVISIIEEIATSVFGLFSVTPFGKFTFKIVDDDDGIDRIIEAYDVSNPHAISYDPTQVLSSVRVGYARDWATASNQYTYYTDTSRQASVYSAYKTYSERTYETLLPDLTAATSFATRVLDYADTVRGVETIIVPIENYDVELGQQIGLVVQRGKQPMIGELKAEVTGVTFDADVAAMRLTVRHGGAIEAYLTTEAGDIFLTEDAAIIMED